jgi:hypothetical protein
MMLLASATKKTMAITMSQCQMLNEPMNAPEY